MLAEHMLMYRVWTVVSQRLAECTIIELHRPQLFTHFLIVGELKVCKLSVLPRLLDNHSCILPHSLTPSLSHTHAAPQERPQAKAARIEVWQHFASQRAEEERDSVRTSISNAENRSLNHQPQENGCTQQREPQGLFGLC